ncbi:MAG: T9SS type A sorting domain-containing protein [Lentimicrobiaceae bacterium]|nr:T9SS type A sorting domain-containing protein [Lentimicrobiaceae bacterium]
MKKLTFLISTILLSLLTQSQNLNLNDKNWFRNGPYCAWVKSLALAPSNSAVVYLGTYSAGLYKTTNGGETWTFCSTANLPVYEDSLENSPSLPCWWFGDYYPIEAIAVHPQDENHLWISALERGLFESKNGGNSWQKANETLPDTLAVNLIHINPQNPDDILLGTGKYFTSGSPKNGGLYRTLDGGNSWNLFDSLPHGANYSISDITRDPINNEHIITAISSSGEPGFSWGLMESYDNGNSWQEISANMYDFKNITIDPENPQNLWSSALTGYQDYWLMNSNDGGENWNLYEGFADPYKWVTGLFTDSDFNLYIKRQSDEPDFSFDILKSTDNGDSWYGIDKLANKTYLGWGTFKNCFQVEKTNTGNIYFGNSYGIYHSEDGGITTQVQNTNLMNSYVLDLEVNPKNDDIIYAAGSQGLWKSIDGGQHWENIIREFLRVIKCNPKHPDTIYFGGRDLWRSYNGGKTYQKIAAPLYSTLVDIAINPIETNVLYYKQDLNGIILIYKSIDYGNTWSLVFTCSINKGYREIVIDPIHPDTLYLGNFRSLDKGSNWSEVFNSHIMAVHPQNSNILYATDGVFQDDHTTIEVSYDWGNTFEVLAEYHNGPFPGNNIYCLRFDKENPDYMFYTTRNTNVYYSLDAGASWQQLQGNYNKKITDIIPYVNENRYFLSTHGDGVWVYDTTTTSVIENNHIINATKALHLSPNPFSSNLTINFTIMNSRDVKLSVFNLNGALIKTLINEYKTKGKYKTIWNGKDETERGVTPGLYLIRLQSGRNIYTSKAVLLE